jgi:hypothetical protein
MTALDSRHRREVQMTKVLLSCTLALMLAATVCGAQTAVVTGTATVGGQPETASVTLTILPKSTVTITLPVSGVSGLPGATINFAIQSSTSRLQPAAEQFVLSAPSATVASFTVTAGASATAAAKTLTCAVPTSPPPPAGTTQLNCVLAGINNTTMANGTIANVGAVLASTAPTGTATISLSNVSVANAFGNAILSSISAPTLTVTVSPTMAMTCAPDVNSVPNAVANQIEPGEVLTCSVTFSSSLAAATTVTLSSNDVVSPGVTVPASVIIASGATSQTLQATGI